ncbi:hypothetical protein GCM10007041_18810 [Butyricimonas faecihominis]|mgnify:CR=1 FL=1|jgi:membrane protein|nr:hypothetical protein Bfae18676_34130 [Butyricimonas faecihominis]GGJ29895.1 hypothetical protein GCM10007041_18810 [Butyricimonas faecihominis]
MIYSLAFAVIAILLTILVSGSFVSCSMAIFTFTLGHLYCNTVNCYDRYWARKAFNIVFSLTTVFACIHYLDTVVDWNDFAIDWKDEYKFWSFTQGGSASDIGGLFYDCFIRRIHITDEGYLFYITALAYVANSLFDGNHLLLQFLGSGLFGSLASIVLFKIYSRYLNAKKAYTNTWILSFCSVVFFYSFQLLRDIHIYFFYLVAFNILLDRFRVKGVVTLILITIIVFQLRFANGLFCLALLVYYFYKQFRKYKWLLPLFIIIVISIFLKYFWEDYYSVVQAMNRYMEFTEEAIGTEQGLSAVIVQLPSGIKETVSFLNFMLQPFPSWNGLLESINIFNGIVEILPVIYQLFWFFVFALTVKWLIFDKKFKELPLDMRWLLIIVFIFICLNLSNPNQRRIMCAYPIIFLVYAYVKEYCIPAKVVQGNKIVVFVCWSCMVLMYLCFKF